MPTGFAALSEKDAIVQNHDLAAANGRVVSFTGCTAFAGRREGQRAQWAALQLARAGESPGPAQSTFWQCPPAVRGRSRLGKQAKRWRAWRPGEGTDPDRCRAVAAPGAIGRQISHDLIGQLAERDLVAFGMKILRLLPNFEQFDDAELGQYGVPQKFREKHRGERRPTHC